VQAFRTDDFIGEIKLVPNSNKDIKFDLQNTDISLDKEILLQRGELKKINLTVSVDSMTNLGDYYYILLARSSATSQVSGSVQLGVEAAVGAPIIISVSESTQQQTSGNITDVTMVGGLKVPFSKTRIFDSFDNPGVRVVIKNSGKYHFSTSGSISVKSHLTKSKSFTIPPQIVFTKSSKLLTIRQDYCNKHQNSERCSLAETLIIDNVGVGRGNITIKVSLPGGIETRSLSYLALPIKLLIVIISSLVLGSYYLKKARP
jgi:hypothetical protein